MILEALFSRRSLENPGVPLSDFDDFGDSGTSRTASGVKINRETALSYAAFWRGVNLISRDVAKVPLLTHRRQGRGWELATEHRAYKLLRRKPNSETTSFIFRQTLQAHALTTGNGYAYIFRAGDASPIELVPLLPDRTWPVRENGQLLYVTQVNGQPRKLLRDNVLHIKGLGFDGLVAYSLLKMARESLGLGIAAHRYGSRFFRNQAKPSVVIEMPGTMKPEAQQEFLRQWSSMHEGLDNSHRTALLQQGAKINKLSVDANDAQLLETRKFEIREIANWLLLPPHKLGDDSRTSYGSLEQENQSYLDDSLDGWLVNWEEECEDKLLTEEEKNSDTHKIEFFRKALVRANLAARAAYFRTALGGFPWMALNEVRGDESLNPVPDGDVIREPLNMGKGGASNEPVPPGKDGKAAGDPADDDEAVAARARRAAAAKRVLVDCLGRMARRLGVHGRKAAQVPTTFLDRMGELADEHRQVIRQALLPAIAAVTGDTDAAADTWADQFAGKLLGQCRDELTAIYDREPPASFATAVSRTLDTFERTAPATLADTIHP